MSAGSWHLTNSTLGVRGLYPTLDATALQPSGEAVVRFEPALRLKIRAFQMKVAHSSTGEMANQRRRHRLQSSAFFLRLQESAEEHSVDSDSAPLFLRESLSREASSSPHLSAVG